MFMTHFIRAVGFGLGLKAATYIARYAVPPTAAFVAIAYLQIRDKTVPLAAKAGAKGIELFRKYGS